MDSSLKYKSEIRVYSSSFNFDKANSRSFNSSLVSTIFSISMDLSASLSRCHIHNLQNLKTAIHYILHLNVSNNSRDLLTANKPYRLPLILQLSYHLPKCNNLFHLVTPNKMTSIAFTVLVNFYRE